uniref:Sushi domain-containing protein n=1 Tax=Oncorhynchus kisutch TaxID=8019 RepID=A0A8C7KJ82_ONCKI
MGEPKCLFFVLLIWCLGTVHAQDSQQSCPKPKLKQGYFGSDEETYQHGTDLYYACDKGWKPAVEGWWAMVKCENRKWSHTPQCIDENDCIAPDNPNTKVETPGVNGRYPNGKTFRFECDGTHEINGPVIATCENGTWTTLPLCEEKKVLCGQPPPVTNAVITSEYQEKFQEGSKINYKCRDSYTYEGTDSSVCQSGDWTTSPKCSNSTSRGNGGTSSGRSHSTSSGGVDRCGEKPTVDNGDFISDSDRNRMALTFTCINYYKLVGPEQVMCHNDQRWSELPICKAPCTIDKITYDLLDLTKDMFVKEGESQTLLCKITDAWQRPFVADVQCQNGQVAIGRCACMYDELHTTQRNRLYST